MIEVLGCLFISIMGTKFLWDLNNWISRKIIQHDQRKLTKFDKASWIEFKNNLDKVMDGTLAVKEGKFVDPQEVEL